jgi:hypothetical protein
MSAYRQYEELKRKFPSFHPPHRQFASSLQIAVCSICNKKHGFHIRIAPQGIDAPIGFHGKRLHFDSAARVTPDNKI